MPSPEPYPGLCGARVKQGEGYCQRLPINGTGRCRLHGGASPGAPKGNQNAVGNSGGGPPEGNWNAAKHHGWSDPLKHYHRLAGEARERVDLYIEEMRDEYARYHNIDGTDAITVESHIVVTRDFETEGEVRDAFRELGATFDQRGRTDGPLVEEGMVIEEEVEYETPDGETVTYTTAKANPALEASHRLFLKRRRLERDLGLIENGRYLSVWLD